MKPHRLSDLLDALYKSINPGYGPGRQKEEFVRALEAVGIRPEHGNRGQELETVVLVSKAPGEVLLRVSRPEGYEDICAELVVVDMAIHEAFHVEIVADVPKAY